MPPRQAALFAITSEPQNYTIPGAISGDFVAVSGQILHQFAYG